MKLLRPNPFGIPALGALATAALGVVILTQAATDAEAAAPNLALNKPARQSSTAYAGDARRAVDGKTDGDYRANSVSHTAEEREAWWEVDLGRIEDISEVRIWNRTDEHGDRLVNFCVLISQRPFGSASLGTLLQDAAFWKSSHPGMAGEKVVIPANTRGRYVRVQLRQKNFLALAEVEVLGRSDAVESPAAVSVPGLTAPAPTVTPQPGSQVNLALNKVARQSSTGFGGDAQRAVDGDTNGRFSANSVSHTTEEKEAWWEVDLARTADIAEVRIWNRTDEHGERLANFYVLISEPPFDTDSLGAALRDQGVWRSFHSGPAGNTTIIKAGTKGRYVRLQLREPNFLSLAEVEVIGSPAAVAASLPGPTPRPPPTVSAPPPPVSAPAPRAERIDSARLTADVGRFRAEAALQPAEAWKRHLTQGAFERLPELQQILFGASAPDIGWSYFFHGAIYVVCPHHAEGAVALFYHPWSDTALLTLWQSFNGRSLVIRADVVPADLVRNPSSLKVDLTPAWLRDLERMSPHLTLPLAAGETLRAFVAMFPVEAAQLSAPPPRAPRDQLEILLDNAGFMKTYGAIASVRLLKCLEGVQRYDADRSVAPYREMTDKVQTQLARGDFSPLAGPTSETLPETLSLLLRLQSELAGYSPVAFTASPQACQVFLSHPAEPKNVLALWYETRGGQLGLRRVDFISHDLGVLLGDRLRTLVDSALTTDPAPANRTQ